MLLVLELFWGAVALELLLWLIPPLRWQRVCAFPVCIIIACTALALVLTHPSIPTILLVVTSAYRIFNLLRLVKARMNEKYLHRMTMQASLWIAGIQALLLLLWGLGSRFHLSTYHLWLVLAYVDLAGSAILLASTIRHYWKTTPPIKDAPRLDSHELPTLTVAIPARNETEDLDACLASLVASDYPKLEILVLDDCSQNKRTPEIIRSFAHAGVLFLQGREPEENWLAKNQAYQQLLDKANGDLVLFCGVDVRFEPESLRLLVEAMLYKHKTMMSVIPRNVMPGKANGHESTLLQPMRYAWEVALPRKFLHRPPVLSTCWIVKRDLLKSAGGFAAVSRSIVPESYFARVSVVHDGYSFMRSNDQLGILSMKSIADQRDTAVRTRYPQLHRRIELVLLTTVAEVLGVMQPYALAIFAVLGHLSMQLTWVSLLTVALLTYTYMSVVALTYRTWLVRSIVLMPVAVILDTLLLNYSMIKYEFLTVLWKGRNVCIPVMRAERTPDSF